MCLSDVCERIREIANSCGFEVEQHRNRTMPVICSEQLEFLLVDDNTIYLEKRISEGRILVSASVRRMGGSPTAEELLHTADEIRRGAELVKRLQGMDLSYTEVF